MNILRKNIPEIFNSAAVQKHGVVYAETRRDVSAPSEELSGSMSVQEYAGDIPLVISQKNYERSGSTLRYEAWANTIAPRVATYDAFIKHELGLRVIGYPNPVHGFDLLDLEQAMASADITTPFPERPRADVSVVKSLGYASCFAPADCPISNVVDTRSGTLVQIHTGYAGHEKGTIAKALTQLSDVIDVAQSVVYVSPHAKEGFVINQLNNGLVERFEANPVMKPFLVKRKNGNVEYDLSEATKQHLIDAGIPEANIQISPDNSITDPTLYSQSRFLTRGTNGRNGMFLGKREK